MKKRDFCKDQLVDNKLQQERQERKKEDVSILLEALAEKIKKASTEKDEVVSEIETLNTELAKAAQEREEQNKAFQAGVSDQRETQKLLKGALKVLSDYYDKASLLELSDATEDFSRASCLQTLPLWQVRHVKKLARDVNRACRSSVDKLTPCPKWKQPHQRALMTTRRMRDPKV